MNLMTRWMNLMTRWMPTNEISLKKKRAVINRPFFLCLHLKRIHFVFKEIHQFLHGAPAMADGVFVGFAHFSESLVETERTKNRVVAETGGSALFGDDFAIDAAFKIVGLIVENQRDDGFKTGIAVFDTLQFGHHLPDIVLKAAILAGIAGGIDARAAAQRLDFESGVIGKAVHIVFFVDIFRLLQGITH